MRRRAGLDVEAWDNSQRSPTLEFCLKLLTARAERKERNVGVLIMRVCVFCCENVGCHFTVTSYVSCVVRKSLYFPLR